MKLFRYEIRIERPSSLSSQQYQVAKFKKVGKLKKYVSEFITQEFPTLTQARQIREFRERCHALPEYDDYQYIFDELIQIAISRMQVSEVTVDNFELTVRKIRFIKDNMDIDRACILIDCLYENKNPSAQTTAFIFGDNEPLLNPIVSNLKYESWVHVFIHFIGQRKYQAALNLTGKYGPGNFRDIKQIFEYHSNHLILLTKVNELISYIYKSNTETKMSDNIFTPIQSKELSKEAIKRAVKYLDELLIEQEKYEMEEDPAIYDDIYFRAIAKPDECGASLAGLTGIIRISENRESLRTLGIIDVNDNLIV